MPKPLTSGFLGVELGHHDLSFSPGDYNCSRSCKPRPELLGVILATFPRWRLPARFRLHARRKGRVFRGRMRVTSLCSRLPAPFPPASILFADAGDGGSRSISGLAKGAVAARKGACRLGAEQHWTKLEQTWRRIRSRSRRGQVRKRPGRLAPPLRRPADLSGREGRGRGDWGGA